MKGNLFAISGPSGAGKGTLVKEVLKRVPDLFLSTSVTTRAPREGEINGVDYFFVSEKDFKEKVVNEEFLEWAVVYGNYYGTLKKFVFDRLNQGKDVILEIDVQGAHQVKEKIGKEAIFVFVFPPSLQELARRLNERRSETPNSLQIRLKVAEEEIKLVDKYDHVIVNDVVEKATNKLVKIILKYRQRGRKADVS